MYLQRISTIHKLNPLTRIFSLFLLWGICIIFQQPLYLLGIFGMIFIIALIGQCFKKIAQVFYLFLGISICSILLWSVGDRIFHLNISREFLLFLLSIWFRTGAVILVGIIFVSCIIVEELDYGLSRLGMYHGFVSLVTGSFRWICLYHKTRKAVIRGQSLRGMDTALQNIREKWSSYILSINITACRFQAITAAMEGKGFGISRRRSYSGNYPVGIKDYISLTVIVFFGAFCLFLRLSGYGG
ncbi:MAG: energy-coupling factor transporter transmembrane component T [bacterium]|nr:energy-coupling factor transporter transmembrane component T [bacterium]